MNSIRNTEANQRALVIAEQWGYIARCEMTFTHTLRTRKAKQKHARLAQRAARIAAGYAIALLAEQA